MRYISVGSAGQHAVTFTQAVLQGLSKNGNLFVPEHIPKIDAKQFVGGDSLARYADVILSQFIDEGSDAQLPLSQMSARAFNFDTPLKFLNPNTAVLELFHGPTCAFKDMGARFLSELISQMQKIGSAPMPVTVVVATSGDTGGAVAGAFYLKPDIDVVILFPEGKISKRQEQQLTAWGDNIRAYAVQGSFDDCQRMAKDILKDSHLRQRRNFVSANSISLGRLLPQMLYHARAALQYFRERGIPPVMLVPTGNLGNAVAAIWAKQMGFPIAKVGLITNANRTLEEMFLTETYRPFPTVSTLANAMDVGAPSNVDRLLQAFSGFVEINKNVFVCTVTDQQIRETISQGISRWGEVWCPHTATAAFAREQLPFEHCIICATAHPAKFETIVEPLIGQQVPVPESLSWMISRPTYVNRVSADSKKFIERYL